MESERFQSVRSHPLVQAFIARADRYLEAIGYTEHGFAHTAEVSAAAARILEGLGFDERAVELSRVAGYLHDIGNCLGRETHPSAGALIAMEILRELAFPPEDIAEVMEAISNHDEKVGFVAGPVSAAVVLADKADARRSRVRARPENYDIHDRVNYSVMHSALAADREKQEIALRLEIDAGLGSPFEYFEIFMPRMLMCRQAAKALGCDFHLEINGSRML